MASSNPGNEVVVAVTSESYDGARTAAAAVGFEDLHLVAREAGLDDWVSRTNRQTIQAIGGDVTSALRMPFPSPTTAAFRESAGFSEGVSTEAGTNRWSLAIASSFDPDQPHDIGVQLVNIKPKPGDRGDSLRIPLDIAVLNFDTIYTRPDRLQVQVGERQLPGHHVFAGEDAQRLVVVAHRFVQLLSSGQAAEQLAVQAASKERPALPARSTLKRLILGEG